MIKRPATPALVLQVALVASLIGGLTTIFTAWDSYGWVLRKVYASDHSDGTVKQLLLEQKIQQDKIFELLSEVQDSQKDNQDQWECDETDEELEDIELQLQEGEVNPVKLASTIRQKEKLIEVWSDLNCSRFTD